MTFRFTTTIVAAALALPFVGGCASRNQDASAHGASAGMISMKVDGMACENCAKHIEHELAEVPGVKAAKVSFKSKTATVTLADQNPATREQLDAAVAKWKSEHFAQETDAECLDPKRREEIKREESTRQR